MEGAKAVDNFVRIYGAKAASIISLTKADSSSQQVADRVNSCTGIYLGDDSVPSNMIEVLRPNGVDSLVLEAIKTVMSKGGMVAGNSAIMVWYTIFYVCLLKFTFGFIFNREIRW